MSVDYRLDGDVAVVTLARPDRFNAIEVTLSTGVVDSLRRAATEARAVVITGAGKAFCSGADLAALIEEYRRDGPDLDSHLEEVFHPIVQALVECPLPTVAGVNGVAAGAGLGMALACDLRVMARSASLISAFTGIGLVPDSGTTWWLPHMIGMSRALELTFTNRRLGAEEVHDLGLCTEVCDDEDLVQRTVALAAGLADLVPDSLVTTRRLIREAAASSFREALRAEQEEQGRLGKTPQHLEGVHAFLEKRKPDFRRTHPQDE